MEKAFQLEDDEIVRSVKFLSASSRVKVLPEVQQHLVADRISTLQSEFRVMFGKQIKNDLMNM